MAQRLKNDTREHAARNAWTSSEIDPVTLAAIEEEAEAAANEVRRRRRVDVLLLAARLVPGSTETGSERAEHMTRAEYAHRSRVSEATVKRWIDEGMPTLPVGSTDRIDPVAADEWRRARGRKPTKSRARAKDDALDVDAALGRAGLRIAGGAR